MGVHYFGTDGIRGRVGLSHIHPEFVLKLGWAIGQVFSRRSTGSVKVLIGKDTRISGYMLESALEAGLSASGVDIQLLGPMPTPAIAYLTRTLRAQAGIVISASHNPYDDNGIKLFSAQGTKLEDHFESEIEHFCQEPMRIVDSACLGRASRITDAPARYIEFCKSTVNPQLNLNSIKVVVDCAHGATYHIAGPILRELGAQVIEIYASPNGFNINEQCGSTHIESLRERVLVEHADLGIALDGDGDRVMMIDHLGEVVNGDEILYMTVKDFIIRGYPVEGVIGTVMSNLGLKRAIQSLGIEFESCSVGDRAIFEALKSRRWLLGGEPSGHIVNLFKTTTGDGLIASLQILGLMHDLSLSLHELRSGFTPVPQILINLDCTPSFDLKDLKIRRYIEDAQDQIGPQGRVLVRRSGTESLVRVMVEGEDLDRTREVAQSLVEALRTCL